MSPASPIRARLRGFTVIAAAGGLIAAGVLVPGSANAVAPVTPSATQTPLLSGDTPFDGWTGPATEPSNGYDFSAAGGVLTASNFGANGAITQLESPVTAEAGEPGYTDASYDTYKIAFTIDGHAGGGDDYAAQPGVSLEMDADEAGNRAGGGLYFTVPTSHKLQIDNFSSTDPFGLLWSGASTHSANIDFNGPVTIEYTVKFVAGGQDVVTVKANHNTILTGAGTYEGYSFATAASTYVNSTTASTPSADKVDQVLFRGTHNAFNTDWTPGNTDVNVAPFASIGTGPSAAGGGFTFSALTYGAEHSGDSNFGSTSTIATSASQIANYEDATTYNGWHVGNNGDSTDTTDYLDVLPGGIVQLNDPIATDNHSTQLLHGIPSALRPTDLYALVAQGIGWTIPSDELSSFQIALTAPAIGGSHFATLHSVSGTETPGSLNVLTLNSPFTTSKTVGTITAFSNAPLGSFLDQLEPGVALDPNSASAEPTAAIAAAHVSVQGFGVANEAITGQSATKVGPIYFGGVKYTFSQAPAITVARPVITGTPVVGVQLKASAAVSPAAAVASYQWFRNGSPIAGSAAKVQKYTATAADFGKKLSVKVTEKLAGFTKASSTSPQTAKVGYGSITKTGSVVIDGTPQVGVRLSITKPTYSPSSVIFAYQWFRNSVAIKGATGSTYLAAPADLGKTITVTVVAKKVDYHWLTLSSAATAAVDPGVLAVTAAPTIKGTTKSGKTLTASSSSWTGNGIATSNLTKRYFWFVSSGSAAPTVADLVQVGPSNTLKLAYWAQGLKVSVYVVGVKDGYTSATSSLSAFTAVVQ